MATFGYTTIGTTSDAIYSDRIKGLFAITPHGTLNSISVALKRTSGSDDYTAKCAIYNEDGTLLESTEEKVITLTTTPTWFTFNFTSPPTVNVQGCFLVVWIDYQGAVQLGLCKDHETEHESNNDWFFDCAYGAWPTLSIDPPWWAGVSGIPSIYCTYTDLGLPALGNLYENIDDCYDAVTWATPNHSRDMLYFGLLFKKYAMSDLETEITYQNALGTTAGYNSATVISRIARARGLASSTFTTQEKATMLGFTWFAAKHWPNNYTGNYCIFHHDGLPVLYALAKKLSYDLAEFNSAFAWQELKAICEAAGTKGVLYGNPITLTYYSIDRFYDEYAGIINTLIELYRVDSELNAAALTYAQSLWTALNATHWNLPEALNAFSYRPHGTGQEGFECEGGFFQQVIMKLYAANNYTLTNSDRLLTDLHTRYLASGWNSPQLMFSNQPVYCSIHHHATNKSRRLVNTLGAWITLHAFYQVMTAADQAAVVDLLNGTTKAWQALLNQSTLYDSATHKFRGIELAATDDGSTAMGTALLFLLGIVPDTGSLYIPLVHMAYEDTYTLNNYFLFDWENRTIRIPVKAGDIKFIYGATPLTVTFDDDGVYELTFSEDWTMLGSKTKIKNLDTRLLYAVRPTLTGLTGGSKMAREMGDAIRNNGEDVTHKILFLDDMVDDETGWYLKDFVDQTIHMWLIEKTDVQQQVLAGTLVILDAMGLTQEDVQEGDQIKDDRGKLWVVTSTKDHYLKGQFQWREVQLTHLQFAV